MGVSWKLASAALWEGSRLLGVSQRGLLVEEVHAQQPGRFLTAGGVQKRKLSEG